VSLIEEITAEITRGVYDRASASTHGNSPKLEILRLKRYLEPVLAELLELPL